MQQPSEKLQETLLAYNQNLYQMEFKTICRQQFSELLRTADFERKFDKLLHYSCFC